MAIPLNARMSAVPVLEKFANAINLIAQSKSVASTIVEQTCRRASDLSGTCTRFITTTATFVESCLNCRSRQLTTNLVIGTADRDIGELSLNYLSR